MQRTLLSVLAGLLIVAAGIFWWQGRVEPEVGTLPLARLAAGSADTLPSSGASDARGAAPPEASEITREQRRFDHLDRDRDGRISRTEMLLPRVAAFKKLDKNGDNLLSFEEWSGRTVDKFSIADTNRDGWLSRAEFATTRQKPKPKPACRCAAPAGMKGMARVRSTAAPPDANDDSDGNDDGQPGM